MSKARKTSPGTAIPGLVVENGPVSQTAHASANNDTTDGAGRQLFRVSDLLLHGAENAVPRRDLMALTGCTDRELRRMIEAERRLGVPILSDCIGGYFLPGSQPEKDRCVRSLRRRAKEIEATATAIERGGD